MTASFISENDSAAVAKKVLTELLDTDKHAPAGVIYANGVIVSTAAPLPVVLPGTTAGAPMPVAPIAGQVGVAGGSGAVGASTQRVVHATDDPILARLPAALGPTTGAGSLSFVPATDALPSTASFAVTPAVSTTPAYTAGDCVGGIMTFASVVSANGKSGLLQWVGLIDKQDVPDTTAMMELWLFTASPALAGDNAAFDPTDAELATLACPPIPLGGWYETQDNAFAGRYVGFTFTTVASRNLFGQLVLRSGTLQYAATSDAVCILSVTPDV